MHLFNALILAAGILSAVPATAATYTIDNNHTSLGFDVGHFGISRVIGRFNTITGGFELSDGGELSGINVSIDAASVDTKVTRRDDHLRTADFFNVAAFPQITFVSSAVKKLSVSTYSVDGEVTLMGVTRPLRAVVTHTGTFTDAASGAVRQGATVSFTVNRSDFGMTGFLSTISDDVNVVFHMEAVKN